MVLPVSATRMELLNLKKRLALARRGHKLLKEKQDELMRVIQELLKKVRTLRREVEREFTQAIQRFLFARASMEDFAVEDALLFPACSFTIDFRKKMVMNVRIPVFEKHFEGELVTYSFYWTSPELDLALERLEKMVERLVELAEYEKALQLLADEMEKTRRRVNALEYILIPNLEDTVKYIQMKLSEMERGNITRLMRIKDVIRKEE